MSFILDALRKSEKKRQSETVPKLQTEHAKPAATDRRRRLWLPILALFLVLNVAVLLWVFGPGQEPPAVVDGLIAAVDPPAPAVSFDSPEILKPAVRTAQKQPPLPIITAAEEPFPAAEGGKVYAIEELPSSIQARIPTLHMSLHAYSKERAAASLVRVNNQMLREGTELAGGFLLAEITADGAVFNYQGYRFLLPRKN
jgi:general secretion pathway protein B